ncbi:MAG: hypothetical protein KDA68_16130 [Planctomycetaceae bacterium]|nr:hypothetical protein [Planctomycetaceae bacterium]
MREADVLVHFNHIPRWCPHAIAETFPALFGETVAIFDVGFGAPPVEDCREEFKHLSRVVHLSIEGPGIDDKWFSEFGVQPRVNMVFIGNTGISAQVLPGLKNWTGLKAAHFQQNKGFTDTIAESSVPDGCRVTLGE